MHASLRSVRIAPKKAALLAKMIRGLPVPEAVAALEHTNKKAARILEKLLRSAMANASHNERQDPQMLVVKTLVVNQAQAYHRGVPMARGRVRPMRKFLSHISLTLGLPEEPEGEGASATAAKKESPAKKPAVSASKAPKSRVQTKKTTKTAADTSTKAPSSTSAKSSPSA